MFPGFAKPSYTPVPDEIFDHLLGTLTHNELRALLYICRRTFGFGKSADAISFNQFLKGIVTQEGHRLDSGCGITNATRLSAALKSLVASGYIAASKGRDDRGENYTTVYELRFREDAWGATPLVGQEVLPDRQYRTTGNGSQVLPVRQEQETVQNTVRQTKDRQATRSRPQKTISPQLALRDPLPAQSDAPDAVWGDVLALLREQTSGANYEIYLADTQLVGLTQDIATIQAANRQQADWLAKRWPALLERALAARLGRRVRCRVVPPSQSK